MQIRQQISEAISKIASEIAKEQVTALVDQAGKPEHGDYASNIALSLAKKLKRNPMEVAEEIVKKFEVRSSKFEVLEKVEVAPPGFINFTLSKDYLLQHLEKSEATIDPNSIGIESPLQGKRIMVEYAHPNTHKEMHIGHMRTLITGEAIVRLLEAGGAKLFRANYQGDIGPHVAKALYGIRKIMEEKGLSLEQIEEWSSKDKAHFLGEGYVRGNVDYESQKNMIDELNTALYAKDAAVMVLYTKTRQWSLDYYDDFYTRFYTQFDRLFFESEMAECGVDIVRKNIGKYFLEDNGAVIFPGEKYGLHTRVFITGAGHPTYEAKDICNAFKQYEAFPFDKNIHVVGSEQAGYFQVVFKALELLDSKKFKDREFHISMGMVTLTDRKMSSRTGDILRVDWLIDQVKEKVQELVKEGKIRGHLGVIARSETTKQSHRDLWSQVEGIATSRLGGTRNDKKAVDDLVEQIAIGAIKYSVLKVGTGQNASFDIEKSVSLDGDSGPYLQYTYARTQSVLGKWQMANSPDSVGIPNENYHRDKLKDQNHKPFAISSPRARLDSARLGGAGHELEPEELLLLRKLAMFEDVVVQAAEKYSPNILCNYLFDLAQLFNLFYQKHKIIGSDEESFRIKLTEQVGAVVKQGLDLLGIKAPEKM